MVIISKGIIYEFAGKHPASLNVLNEWWIKTKSADWQTWQDVKKTFNSCDSVGNDRYVFDIGGNNYRLVALIHFTIRTVFIRGIFTHPEYERISKRGRITQL
jgi:mRNA interferase HigB